MSEDVVLEEHELRSVWEHEGKIDEPLEQTSEWLKQQSPDTWHAIASTWNWDYGSAPLLWMAQQPACDFGTGLTIFAVEGTNWMTTPTWEELSSKTHQDSWKACDIIVKRWKKGSFGSAELRLAPNSDGMRIYRTMEARHAAKGQSIAWDVPDFVDNYIGNRREKSDYTSMDGALYWDFEVWKQKNGFGAQLAGSTSRGPNGGAIGARSKAKGQTSTAQINFSDSSEGLNTTSQVFRIMKSLYGATQALNGKSP